MNRNVGQALILYLFKNLSPKRTWKEILALILANFFRLLAAANRLKVDKNSTTRYVILIFENAALGLFWNNATKIKRKKSLQRDSFS